MTHTEIRVLLLPTLLRLRTMDLSDTLALESELVELAVRVRQRLTALRKRQQEELEAQLRASVEVYGG